MKPRLVFLRVHSEWLNICICFPDTSGIHLSIGEPEDETESSGGDTTAKKNYTKTGNPKIDYVHDPNLPR
jgi:hypothetical protein